MPARRGWMTLGRFFGVLVAALAVLLVGLLSAFYVSSRRTILMASEELMAQAGRRIAERVSEHLGEAELATASFERQVAAGLVRPADAQSLENALAREL